MFVIKLLFGLISGLLMRGRRRLDQKLFIKIAREAKRPQLP